MVYHRGLELISMERNSVEGDTENAYLYTGEYKDEGTGLYYLRARYMNPAAGNFLTMDTYERTLEEPASQHKYGYVHANPVDYNDPTGHMAGVIARTKYDSAVAVAGMKFLAMARTAVATVNAVSNIQTMLNITALTLME